MITSTQYFFISITFVLLYDFLIQRKTVGYIMRLIPRVLFYLFIFLTTRLIVVGFRWKQHNHGDFIKYKVQICIKYDLQQWRYVNLKWSVAQTYHTKIIA